MLQQHSSLPIKELSRKQSPYRVPVGPEQSDSIFSQWQEAFIGGSARDYRRHLIHPRMNFLWFLRLFPPLQPLMNFLLLADSNSMPVESTSWDGHGHEGDTGPLPSLYSGSEEIICDGAGQICFIRLWHLEQRWCFYALGKSMRIRDPVSRIHLAPECCTARQALALLLLTTWTCFTSGRK